VLSSLGDGVGELADGLALGLPRGLRLGLEEGRAVGVSSSGLMLARGVVSTITAGSWGAEPAAPPLSWFWLGLCSDRTAGGEVGTSVAFPNWAPSHMAGPSPTAMMAPKSASGPRSISAPPPWFQDDDPRTSELGSTQFAGRSSEQRLSLL
jgi:hypothetical protein